MLLGKLGIGILAGTLTLGTGGAVAANQAGILAGPKAQARCETFQARFAQNLGITTDKLQATRKQTALQLIDEKLAAGTITAAQAQQAKDKVNASPGVCERIGQRTATIKAEVGKVELQAIAKQFGITEKELLQEVRGGKSLAQVAQGHNVTREQLKTTMHDAFKGELDQAVAANKLTQERATAALAKFDASLDTIIDHVGMPNGKR